jgi:hypothetical protein
VQYEEALVCAGAKLAELADAEKPTTWEQALVGLVRPSTTQLDFAPYPTFSGHLPPPVTFRVLAAKDKFLVRNLAMELLSYVPLVDQLPLRYGPTSSNNFRTAAEAFAAAAVTANVADVTVAYNATSLTPPAADASKFYPALAVASNAIDWPTTARRHLEMQGAALRAASQLLADLTQKNVYGALAGAAEKASSLPASERGKAVWADGTDGNSMAQVARTLFGRLGTLNMTSTPGIVSANGCSSSTAGTASNAANPWVIPEQMWEKFAPAGLKSRGNDVAPRFGLDLRADALLGMSGVVATTKEASQMGPLKSRIYEEIRTLEAPGYGFTPAQFDASLVATNLQAQLAGISTETMRGAVLRQQTSFATLTNNVTQSQNTIQSLGLVATSIPGLGFKVGEAVPRQEYYGDLFGPLGAVQAASECTGIDGSASLAPSMTASHTLNVLLGDVGGAGTSAGRPGAAGPPFAPDRPFTPRMRAPQFQDVFAVGQTLRQRLVRLRAAAAAVPALSTGLTGEDISARGGAIFETEGWAGATRVVVSPNPALENQFIVSLFDFRPEDFGLPVSPTETDLRNAFALVVEPKAADIEAHGDLASVAQCASGSRARRCSAQVANYVWKPASVNVNAYPISDAGKGRVRRRYDLIFSRSAVPNVPVRVTEAGTDDTSVAKLAKAFVRIGNAETGQVLGTTRSYGTFGVSPANRVSHATSFAVSPLRRKLVMAAFGFAKTGDLNASLADSRDYCIQGVPRDVFVPLENELTSDSDGYESSWRHYLTIARQSAQRADALGQEWIELGLRKEERKEGAFSAAEKKLGYHLDKDCIENVGVDRDYSKCGDVVDAAMNSAKFDLVLLSNDPKPANLYKTIGCGVLASNVRSPVCQKLEQAGVQIVYVPPGGRPGTVANTVYYTALDMVNAESEPSRIDECGSPGWDPYTNLEQYLAPTASYGERWAADDDALRSVLRNARLSVGNDGNFYIEAGGSRFVDSTIPSVTSTDVPWPACLGVAGMDPCGFTTETNARFRTNRVLNRLFRACPGGTTALGTCDVAGAPDAATEVNGIRWRLMGALFLAQSMGGQVPRGAFDIPVPATSFPASTGGLDGPVCALHATVYGTGRFAEDGMGSGRYLLTGNNPGLSEPDMNQMGVASAVHANFAKLPVSAIDMPKWYRALYKGTEDPTACYRQGVNGLTYYHVRAQNEELVSNTHYLHAWLNAPPGAVGEGLKLSGWRALAKKVQAADPQLQLGVGALKTWFDPRSAGQSFYADRFAPEFFMLAQQIRGLEYFGPGQRISNNPVPLFERVPTEYRWTGSNQDPVYASERVYDCFGDFDNQRSSWGRCAYGSGDVMPARQPPSKRARFFINALVPRDPARAVADAAALACIVRQQQPVADLNGTPAPPITSRADLGRLSSWLYGRSVATRRTVAGLYLESVPAFVVAAANTQTSGAGKFKGQIGLAAIEATSAMRALSQSYGTASHRLTLMQGEVSELNARLATIEADHQVQLAENSLKRLQMTRGAVESAVAAAKGVANPYAAAGLAALSLTESAVERLKFEAIDDAQTVAHQAQANAAIVASGNTLERLRKEQSDALVDTRDKSSAFQAKLLLLDQLLTELRGDIEQAMGAGAWTCKGEYDKDIVCRSPLNAVLNARYSGTRIRYENALLAARASAYYARRAIEQRLGVRLASLENDIGALQAPSKWADRVCTMQGVNYETLRRAEPFKDAAEKKAWEELRARDYANGFIGDYVELLAQFVESYNVAFPSQDGNDTALLSLATDVHPQTGSCLSTSKNRLYSSDSVGTPSVDNIAVDQRWQIHRCAVGATRCIDVRTWRATASGTATLPAQGAWLSTHPRSERDDQGIVGPSGFMSQAVLLPSGDYVLSFRDAAIDPTTGGPTLTPAGAYRVSVFDETGQAVTTGVFTPAPATGGPLMSVFTPRHLKLSVASAGRYRIAFSPSAVDGGLGSVVIVEPQVERDRGDRNADGSYDPRYESTNASGQTVAASCASGPAELRSAFRRVCDAASGVSAPARCYYESKDPFVLNTATFAINGNSLADKLAADNYNYRHVDLALNLVGTGVRSCDENPTPGCYAAGTIDYDIVHEANQVGIVGYDKETRRFDFGEGAIRHGKALSAEKYLTLPLSGGDSALLAQTGVTKTELRGRPLDGRYRIRIYDAPNLRWSNLEDVQLVVKYRYWSRVAAPKP